MAAVSRPVNAEVIEVSDSDERGGTSGHVEPDWVRRSTRRRKASVRFSPDDEPTTSHKTPSRPAGRTSDKRLRMSDSSELTSDSNSSSGYEMELVHPQALITYIEKLKRKIRPGQFGINMPVGPNEFVLVDAVDYLRNLGYSNFEEVGGEVEDGENEVEEEENDAEEEKHKTELKFFESIKEEDVLFESQAAVKLEGGNGDSNESEEKLQEVNFWDQLGVHSKSSESRNQDLSDVIRVAQQQVEHCPLSREPPPPDPFIQAMREQVEKDWEHLNKQPCGYVETPKPIHDPWVHMEGLANYVKFTTHTDSSMAKITNSDAAMVTFLEIARWLPAYQRIVQERDVLLDRQRQWVEHRDTLSRERDMAWEALEAAKAQSSVEPPAARTTGSEATVQMPAEPPDVITVKIETELAYSPTTSPLQWSSSTTPTPPTKSAHDHELASSVRDSDPCSPTDSHQQPLLATPFCEAQVILEDCLKYPTKPQLVLKLKKRASGPTVICPVCTKKASQLFSWRCPACKEFWQRLKNFYRRRKPLPNCPEDHSQQRDPADCRGCRRHAYELALRKARPTTPLPIPSVVLNDPGSQRGSGCEP